jgi:thiamine-phosphate pyrophosphorylase
MTPRLLVLTDRSQLPLGRPLVDTLRDCVDAGAEVVVVRELDESYPARAALVRAVIAMGAQAIVSRTLMPGASAVHLPARGPGVAGRFGRSCHSAGAVERAAAEGAAYATLSPYATTRSKRGYGPPLRPADYREAAGHGIPVYALGGVTPANAAAAVEAGAHGVAVMGEVMRAADPGAVVADLLEAIA